MLLALAPACTGFGQMTLWYFDVGEKASVADYVLPPRMLSKESTKEETTWSLGEYVEPELVLARVVGADAKARRRLGRSRRLGEHDLHPPEVPDELIAAPPEQIAAVVVDDACLDAEELVPQRPVLGEAQ